eukprot:1153857-Pelagomonas_calceolata.AAC.4
MQGLQYSAAACPSPHEHVSAEVPAAAAMAAALLPAHITTRSKLATFVFLHACPVQTVLSAMRQTVLCVVSLHQHISAEVSAAAEVAAVLLPACTCSAAPLCGRMWNWPKQTLTLKGVAVGLGRLALWYDWARLIIRSARLTHPCMVCFASQRPAQKGADTGQKQRNVEGVKLH